MFSLRVIAIKHLTMCVNFEINVLGLLVSAVVEKEKTVSVLKFIK